MCLHVIILHEKKQHNTQQNFINSQKAARLKKAFATTEWFQQKKTHNSYEL